jgi:hypothetical protein
MPIEVITPTRQGGMVNDADDQKKRAVLALVRAVSNLLVELMRKGMIKRSTMLTSLKPLHEATEEVLSLFGIDPVAVHLPKKGSNGNPKS